MKISYVHPLDPAHVHVLTPGNLVHHVGIEKVNDAAGNAVRYRLTFNGRDMVGWITTPFFIDGAEAFTKYCGVNDMPNMIATCDIYHSPSDAPFGFYSVDTFLMPIKFIEDIK